MQKISTTVLAGFALLGLALPALAQVEPHLMKEQKEKLVCIQKAVQKRETAIIGAFSEFSNETNAALTTRMRELVAAWDLEDRKARQSAISAAWKKYKESSEATHKKFKDAKKDIWEQFKLERKNCPKLAETDDN
jgi:hypothetical protein